MAYPNDGTTNVGCYCNLFCYVKGTIEHSLLSHVRAREVGDKLKDDFLDTPIKTQIKPPVISLPFLIFENNDSKNSAIKKLRDNIDEFEALASGKNKCEKLFSEWAYDQIDGE